MNYIKKFNELLDSTYKSAGDKLISLGALDRGRNLIEYNKISEIKDKDKFYVFVKGKVESRSLPKISIVFNVNGTSDVFDDGDDESIEDRMLYFRNNKCKDLSLYVDIKFEEDTESFSFEVDIIRNNLFYIDMKFDFNSSAHNYTFSDRRSAKLLMNTIKEYFYNFPIDDIISLSGININQSQALIDFYEIFDKVNIHMLYDTRDRVDIESKLRNVSLLKNKNPT